ncbi:hypothetical protein [Streptomyces sp. NPDC058572]|uniref:hypothetical protein n=1 Tax=Streptomyces sp. NPDC058572 TaxID=3346546 RepID=UPI0036590A8F
MPNSQPPLWFRLPPGYHNLDAIGATEIEQVSLAVLPLVLENEQFVERAHTELRTVLELISRLDIGAAHASIGVHPDGENGASVSLFSLSVTEIEARTPALAAAQGALAVADSSIWQAHTCRFIGLPAGVPAGLVVGLLSPPPVELLEHAGICAPVCEVFQARLTVPFPTGRHLAVADLTSTATRHADSYTDILECIAGTMAFADPEMSTAPAPRHSRILELF